ncbi:Two-component response regulator-like APRR1 [Hibiscus syriacus]|uniref:Two-component response regulator-like APRR1 n=1 Tax=Hibiscus syriacus TaxID=106335 RepID=A0A6A2Y5G2_HIBSY|nr:Two-component response regulator-like APRR1 [Hibiscus syriacus]
MERNELNLNKAEDGFIDRSKVRILLCDIDKENRDEVSSLLLKCSYQVMTVMSARRMIKTLNAEGPEIDIILSEVNLPITKGMKMLKHVMRDKELRHISVIMMLAQDDISAAVKCSRFDAAGYLVKPLRKNGLSNLWTPMWRRRHLLGLADKNVLNCGVELIASDPSDANTNSSTLFSDDQPQTSTNPEMGVTAHWEDESAAIAGEPPQVDSSDCHPGQLLSGPKKSKLNIGGLPNVCENWYTWERYSWGNQVPMPSSPSHLFQNNLPDLRNCASSLPQLRYHHLQQCHSHPHASGMAASFPYFQVDTFVLSDQVPTSHSCTTFGTSSSGEKRSLKVDRREAALTKFRQKRKVFCFDKRIRYANRKTLAETRTRAKGQFARKVIM